MSTPPPPPTDEPLVLTQTLGRTRLLTLNRPEVRNALNTALRDALTHELIRAETDQAVRAVVLTGRGEAFCAGLDLADLRAMTGRSSEENREDTRQLAALFERLYTFPKPVVAAVNGYAVAGGAGLASVCDLTIMSDQAKMGYTEARIGFVAALVSVFLVRQVGEKAARDLLLSARLVSATEAKAMGLVNEVTPKESVLTRALETAEQLAQNAPTSLMLTKTLLAALPSMGLGEALGYATDLNAFSRTTADLKEGVSAFLEKREPTWKR